MLKVLDDASRRVPLEISATFCGAHAVPKGSSEREQTQLIVEKILPEIERRQKFGQLKTLENIDVSPFNYHCICYGNIHTDITAISILGVLREEHF
jgi:hypothetical protein